LRQLKKCEKQIRLEEKKLTKVSTKRVKFSYQASSANLKKFLIITCIATSFTLFNSAFSAAEDFLISNAADKCEN
jgi:hypothetical protein